MVFSFWDDKTQLFVKIDCKLFQTREPIFLPPGQGLDRMDIVVKKVLIVLQGFSYIFYSITT